MSGINDSKSKLNTGLQIATILLVIFGYFFNHYSQKKLIEHKAEIDKHVPAIFGTASHTFLRHSKNVKKIVLNQVMVFDKDKYIGEIVRLDGSLITYPVLIALRIENHGNEKAANVKIIASSPLNSLMHGELQTGDMPYQDCKINESSGFVRSEITCESLKQGEAKTFHWLWIPNFETKNIENYRIEETTIGNVDADDLIEVNVLCDNGPEGIILEGSILDLSYEKKS